MKPQIAARLRISWRIWSMLGSLCIAAHYTCHTASAAPTNYRSCDDQMKYGVLRKSGDTFYEDGLTVEAEKCYRIAVRIHTKDVLSLFRLGNLARQHVNPRAAADWYMKALVHRNNMSEAHNNLGITYTELGRWESALTSFERALRYNPGLADAHYNRANTLKEAGKVKQALLGYRRAVELAPDAVQYYNNYALAHMAAGDYRSALETCDLTLRIDPKYPTAHYNLANALLEVGNLEQAVRSYQAAIQVQPGEAEYHHNLGFTYERMRKPVDAVRHLRRAVALKEQGFVEARCNLVDLLHGSLEWRSVAAERHSLAAQIDVELEANSQKAPLPLPRGLRCAAHLPPKLLLELSQAQATALEEAVAMLEPFEHNVAQFEAGQHMKLRVGYTAAGFAGATMLQHVSGALVSHSKGVEVRAFSLVPGGRNDATDKINRAVNARWIDVGTSTIDSAAKRIRDEKVHVLVSLDGFSAGDRVAIVALRPGPVQAAYRSHPGSNGADWLDYNVGDAFTSPPDMSWLFHERLVALPITAHANDYWRLRREHDLVPMRMSDREDYGLPEKRVVLQNLGLYNRMDPVTWQSWTNTLGRLPNATLWLLRATNEGQTSLERELLSAGIDVENNRNRARFSDPVPREEHIRRSALGDVHLDTPLNNGHTMTIETMWSGTPVVAMPLQASTQRTAAGVLHATQLPGLADTVVHTRKELEDMVVTLCRKPPQRSLVPYSSVRMFDLSDWVSGGLNPLMQRYTPKGRKFILKTKRH